MYKHLQLESIKKFNETQSHEKATQLFPTYLEETKLVEKLIVTTKTNIEKILCEKQQHDIPPTELTFYGRSIAENKHLLQIINNQKYLAIYSFLKYGIAVNKNVLSAATVKDLISIYKLTKYILNKQANSKSTIKSLSNSKTIRNYQNVLTHHQEFIYRSNENNSFETCTIDVSLNTKYLKCDEIKYIFENLLFIQQLKKMYQVINNQHLDIVNWGFFESPSQNTGQNLHCDDDYIDAAKQETQLPTMVTAVICVTPQYASKNKDTWTTSGSTKFVLKSMHSVPKLVKLAEKTDNEIYRYIQIILNPGETILFGGNLLHAGGSNNFPTTQPTGDRLLCYAVYSTIKDETPSHDEQCTCWKCREEYMPFLCRKYKFERSGNEWILKLATRETSVCCSNNL